VRLKSQSTALVNSLLKEQMRAGELRAHGLEPRHKLLLVGPPGNGKTSLAEAIAGELGRIFLVVRCDGLIASYLGETAARLKRVFDIARSMPCVLFFDEVETIAKERGDANETGEIKRVLTSLMMQIDELPSTCLLIAATNHPEMLDRALWRRFQVRIDLPEPSLEELRAFMTDAIAPIGKLPKGGLKTMLDALGKASYSDAEELALSVRRRQVLDGTITKLPAIFAAAREEWILRTGAKLGHDAPTASEAAEPDR
jgi:AAA+ superfamily predicted ATPase